MKPYHALLLLEDVSQVLRSLSADTSPSLIRFLKSYSPIKNFQVSACDADLTLAQVYIFYNFYSVSCDIHFSIKNGNVCDKMIIYIFQNKQ